MATESVTVPGGGARGTRGKSSIPVASRLAPASVVGFVETADFLT